MVSATLLLLTAPLLPAQVSPNEILNPQLKTAEKTYLKKLVAVNTEVAAFKFPFSFSLCRYAGVDPQHRQAIDKRGLEFVWFHDRIILKVTGNYNAAFNADQLTANQRSSRVFKEVILPILQILPNYFAPMESFDAFGFEISYHTRTGSGSYVFEGKEILVIVLDKADLFRFVKSQSEADRQEILNLSEIYLNGKDFGLALDQRDPFNLEALDRPRRGRGPVATGNAVLASSSEPSSPSQNLQSAQVIQPPVIQRAESTARVETAVTNTSVSPASLEHLQAKYQTELDQLNKEGLTHHHFVQYAPPSFGIFRSQIFLQISLRNPAGFARETTSIYKRAAQSFDLFLAPQMKSILSKIPDSSDFEGLEITILNELIPKSPSSSEAIEFICPIKPLRQFANAEITNQELINQSVVLVNEVRIALNLQIVE